MPWYRRLIPAAIILLTVGSLYLVSKQSPGSSTPSHNQQIVDQFAQALSAPLLQPAITTNAAALSGTIKPDSVSPVVVAIYGDSRDGDAIHRELVAQMVAVHPAATIHLGDVADTGSDVKAWTTFWKITATLRQTAPFWIVSGNHELPINQFAQYFPDQVGNHFEDIDGIRFLFLDLESGVAKAVAYLQAHATDRTIVCTHEPVLTAGPHQTDSIVKEAAQLLPAELQRLSIKLVLSGHDHAYQRIVQQGITYVVTAGGGAALYNLGDISGLVTKAKSYHWVEATLTAAAIKLQVWDQSHQLLDAVSIAF